MKLHHVILMVLLLAVPASAQTLQNLAESQRDCAVCHLEWSTDFDAPGAVLLIDKPTISMASDESTCLGCHDGSVRDSRKKVWQEQSHKTGVTPPPTMQIPSRLPLDNGKIACRTCHTANNVQGSANLANIFFLRVQNDKSQLCQTCHAEKTGGPTHGSHPLGKSTIALPVNLAAAGAKSGPAGAELICQSCHEAHGSKADKLLVLPVAQNALCMSCHDKLQPGQWGTSGSHTHPTDAPLSTDVQRQAIRDLGTHLGPADTLACLSCHRLHDAKTGARLLADTQKDAKLCLRCHPDHAIVQGTQHDLRKTAPTARNALGQTADDAGPCGECHEPHQSPRPPVVAAGDPSGQCLSCHADGKLAATLTGPGAVGPAHFNHPDDVSRQKLPADLTLAVFTNAADSTRAALTCQTCHNPHDATRKNFLRNSPDQLCATCHTKQASTLAGAHDLTTRPSARNGLGETGAESGKCGFCHDVHKGSGKILWAATANAPATGSALCTSCHRTDGLAKDHPAPAVSHPGVIASAGVSMPLPLFNAAGERVDQRGMVQCASCHDPHSDSTQSHLMLRVAGKTPDALCTTCHSDQASTLAGEHDFTTRPDARNGLGKTAAESGKCGFCHSVHNGNGSFLWAATKNAPTKASELCTNCHQTDGLAKDHPAPAYSHPTGVPVANVTLPLPLFDAIGQRVEQGAPTAMVQCASCHNPHSDSTKSHLMLRVNGSVSDLCVRCHDNKLSVAGGKHDSRVNRAWPVATDSKESNDLCMSCHRAHSNDDARRTWAMQPDTFAATANERRCLGCHNDQFAKRPEIPQHPAVVFDLIALRSGSPATQPAAEPKLGGAYMPSEQSIPCGVCHEPHSATHGTVAGGQPASVSIPATQPSALSVEVRGATRTMIRPNVARDLCSTCHGPDSERVLLYYHRARERQEVQGLQQPGVIGYQY